MVVVVVVVMVAVVVFVVVADNHARIIFVFLFLCVWRLGYAFFSYIWWVAPGDLFPSRLCVLRRLRHSQE